MSSTLARRKFGLSKAAALGRALVGNSRLRPVLAVSLRQRSIQYWALKVMGVKLKRPWGLYDKKITGEYNPDSLVWDIYYYVLVVLQLCISIRYYRIALSLSRVASRVHRCR